MVFNIGDRVRFKTDDDKQPTLVVRSIFLGNENVSSEAFCVSECGRRMFWASSSNLELVNRPDPQADLKQAIREVLLSDEFLAAFAAAWVKTPILHESEIKLDLICDPITGTESEAYYLDKLKKGEAK